ncbi:hypothetical protein GIB67_025259 [Kingdonia uniflora]|uniref:cyclin-dependent kinase n=1 Tax=Kingdonia uniflora TaxID=39325 RepID=A0A7J7NBF8_9MAGN|nr:hypothetical protein GIB67_025259 [Kingdonia uniflora]
MLLCQARILLDPIIVAGDDAINDENGPDQQEISSDRKTTIAEESGNQDQRTIGREEYSKVNNFKSKELFDGTYKSTNLYDRDTSCLATCTTSDRDDDILKGSTCSYKGSSYSFDAGEENVEDGTGSLTSCVGTRWYRAPELLYGSTDYAQEIDLWSLGCIFAELISLDPLFPGNSDIDQLSRIINVLGNFNEETWPGCSKLPDYGKMFFGEIESPLGLQSRLPNRSSDEVKLIQRLVCYNPSSRATALDLPSDRYFSENPLPVSVSELRVPSTNSDGNERSPREEWFDDSGSDLEEFGGNNVDVRTTDTGFSIRFSP